MQKKLMFARGVAAVALAFLVSSGASAQAAQKTIDNLKAAFAGETTAFSKYTQYAKKATAEGKTYEARLFRAAARAEGYHARNHRAVLKELGTDVKPSAYKGQVGSTKANLKDALKGESYERDTMYPKMIAEAKDEGVDSAVHSFNLAAAAESQHATLYGAAVKKTGTVKDSKAAFYVCPKCGATFEKKSPALCPTCSTPREKFNLVR